MNRGIRRGIGLDAFWPHANGVSSLVDGEIPAFDSTAEGMISFNRVKFSTGQPTFGAGIGLGVSGAVTAENAFLGLCFMATQGSNQKAALDLRSYGGTATAATATPSGTSAASWNVGMCSGANSDGSPSLQDVAEIDCVSTDTIGASAFGAKWQFQTCANGTTTKNIIATLDNDGSAKLSQAALTRTASFTDVTVGAAQTFSTTSSMTHTAFSYSSTDTWSVAPLGLGFTFQGISFGPTIKNASGSNISPGGFQIFSANPTLQVDTQTGIDLGANVGYSAGPTFNVANSGTFTAGAYQGFKDAPTVNAASCTLATVTNHNALLTVTAGTVTTRTGYLVTEATGAGTLTNNIGVDIPQLTKGATINVGLRCAGAMVYTPVVCTCTSNAATVPVTIAHAKVTNSSAATCTITLATTNAQDGQETLVRYFDSSAASQTVTFTNSETGKAGAPPASLGSTTIPSTYRFIYNSGTSKWTYTGN